MARPAIENPNERHDIAFSVRLSGALHDHFEAEAIRRDIPKTIIIREYLVQKVREVELAKKR